MKCTEIRDLLPDLASGLGSAAPEVNDHLRSCADCSGSLEEFRKTMALLDLWQAPEPSPYFDTRLKARLREERAKQPAGWFAWIGRPALVASLAAVVVIGGTWFGLEVKKKTDSPPTVAVAVEPGTAVGDLQALDKNHDIYADSDLLDDLQVQEDVNANP